MNRFIAHPIVDCRLGWGLLIVHRPQINEQYLKFVGIQKQFASLLAVAASIVLRFCADGILKQSALQDWEEMNEGPRPTIQIADSGVLRGDAEIVFRELGRAT
jgi:hypothetical protein